MSGHPSTGGERGCGGTGCILAREAGGQVVGICRCLPRELAPEDRVRLYREIGEQRAELLALRAIVEGHTTAPTVAEIAAHPGPWLVQYVDGGYDVLDDRSARALARLELGHSVRPVRWWPLGDGRPCAWPEVSRG